MKSWFLSKLYSISSSLSISSIPTRMMPKTLLRFVVKLLSSLVPSSTELWVFRRLGMACHIAHDIMKFSSSHLILWLPKYLPCIHRKIFNIPQFILDKMRWNSGAKSERIKRTWDFLRQNGNDDDLRNLRISHVWILNSFQRLSLLRDLIFCLVGGWR